MTKRFSSGFVSGCIPHFSQFHPTREVATARAPTPSREVGRRGAPNGVLPMSHVTSTGSLLILLWIWSSTLTDRGPLAKLCCRVAGAMSWATTVPRRPAWVSVDRVRWKTVYPAAFRAVWSSVYHRRMPQDLCSWSEVGKKWASAAVSSEASSALYLPEERRWSNSKDADPPSCWWVGEPLDGRAEMPRRSNIRASPEVQMINESSWMERSRFVLAWKQTMSVSSSAA
mmetsp:Transcript_12610/g.36060  ORF Transcript_12610/g.36060 Transcript_12610/m.36060 type:complete len:228 (-) Transcript_12610:1053-1736(-)